ncbi:hypothetical protein M975_1908 [Buttiauxella brennerae ATCC 51605]|uniref:Uncharacterized protein n=1 Tax=Buttiauxella brennerae ATCC 51605 TaxID=1354251 RepID=A0A1B7IQJ3_9ENTR|nr:hypothetical protein [Buttiauxella brennerae]OAT32016.1 hypothetical protein M975_1908 [Buttiauxella brennerae ATCC 51605]
MTTSPLKVEDSRAQFEAEFRKQYSFDKHLDLLLEMYNHGTDEEPDIDYYSLAARDAWKWWQASRAAIVVELDKCNCDNGEESVWDDAIEYCEVTLRAAGITVKGDSDEANANAS